MAEALSGCPFCHPAPGAIIAQNAFAVALSDAYPVSPGHALIVPRRHIESWFEASAGEREALVALVDEVKGRLDHDRQPDGYNIGVNVGAAAGQTVGHVHVHVIPRYEGDVLDPRGGIRWVLPDRATYWMPSR